MKRTDKATELQRRRRKAGRLLLKGVTQAEVARRVGALSAAIRTELPDAEVSVVASAVTPKEV